MLKKVFYDFFLQLNIQESFFFFVTPEALHVKHSVMRYYNTRQCLDFEIIFCNFIYFIDQKYF